MANYTIHFTSKNHPTDVDAVNVGLRVTKDDEYFQFFLASVSGIDLATVGAVPDDQWYAALAMLGVDRIKQAIEHKLEPDDDPTQAILLNIAVRDVTQRAKVGGLPTLHEGLVTGHEIASFEA
jgi:hypothetical protein